MFHESVSQTTGAINHIGSQLTAWLVVAALCIGTIAGSAVTLNVSPNTISNDYTGVVTLQISGLNAGETVIVERFSDFNGDGAPGSEDIALQAFPLTDGEAVVFGGVTNLHVPGDMDGIAGSITANLYMQTLGFEQKAVGKHVYRVSSPTDRFTPVTMPFTVTNSPYASQVSGQVTCSGTNVPNALIVLFQTSGGDVNPVLCGASDASGNYSLKVQPGVYLAASFKSNYVSDFSAGPIVALAPGSAVTTNLPVTFATRHITGRISNSSDPLRGLGGLLTVAQASGGKIAVGFTDRNGSFSIGVTPGIWKVEPDDSGAHFLGYPALESGVGADCTSSDVTGLSITLPKGRAMIYGTVNTDTASPMPGIMLYGGDWDKGLSLTPKTDQLGRYFTPIVAGTWDIGIDLEDNPSYSGYVFSQPFNNIAVQDSTAVRRNFLGKLAPYLVSGFLKDSNQTPLEGIGIWMTAYVGGTYYTSWTKTDSSGFFSMPACNGIWTVGATCDGEEGLRPRGYHCMSGTEVTVANANAAVTLVAQPCTGLQILTTSLPNGRVNEYYSQYLSADTCNDNVSWSLAYGSGSLPSGLSLQANGQISGSPSQSGQWSFTVQADDGNTTATKSLSLQIENTSVPLYIANGSLPDGTNGVSYTVQMEAGGGQPPYAWSLAPGSGALPTGLTLSTNGYVAGTPTQSGQFYFWARVTDATQATADKMLAVYVATNPGLSTPPTMASPTIGSDGKFRFLVNGFAGIVYTIQVSTNLQSWSTVGSTNAPSNSFTVVGDAPTNPALFYRVLVGQ